MYAQCLSLCSLLLPGQPLRFRLTCLQASVRISGVLSVEDEIINPIIPSPHHLIWEQRGEESIKCWGEDGSCADPGYAMDLIGCSCLQSRQPLRQRCTEQENLKFRRAPIREIF